MPGAGDVDHVEVVAADHPVEVGGDEVLAGRRAPVPEKAGLDVPRCQRLAQERVVEEVDLADREVVRRPPIGVDERQLRRRQRGPGAGRPARGGLLAPDGLGALRRRLGVGGPSVMVFAPPCGWAAPGGLRRRAAGPGCCMGMAVGVARM